jgi:hypothetical protein
MKVTKLSPADKMARYLKPRLQGDPRVVGLWSRQWGPEAHLWLLVNTPSMEEESAFREIMWELLEQFPDGYIDFYVGNLGWGDANSQLEMIPSDATRTSSFRPSRHSGSSAVVLPERGASEGCPG